MNGTERTSRIASKVAAMIAEERPGTETLAEMESGGLDLHAFLMDAPEYAEVWRRSHAPLHRWIDRIAAKVEEFRSCPQGPCASCKMQRSNKPMPCAR